MTTTVLGTHILFAIMLFAFSVVATFVVLKLKILDEPNQRSSHDRPTLNRLLRHAELFGS